MQNVSIQKASELPDAMKSAIEQLLGRPILAEEEISIAAIPPRQIPPSDSRAAVAQKLEALLDRRAAKVSDVADQALDSGLDEALEHVRHSRGRDFFSHPPGFDKPGRWPSDRLLHRVAGRSPLGQTRQDESPGARFRIELPSAPQLAENEIRFASPTHSPNAMPFRRSEDRQTE